MAEQPYARFYRGLPPVVSHRRRRRLMGSAFFIIVGAAITVPVFVLAYAAQPVPGGGWIGGGGGDGLAFDRNALISILGAFIIGGLLGFALARTWWITVALYAVGLAIWLALMPFSNVGVDTYYHDGYQSAAGVFGWIFWIFGVSAGLGVRHLIERRRVLRASYISRPA